MAIAVIAFPLSLSAAASRVVISLVDRDCGVGEGGKGPLSRSGNRRMISLVGWIQQEKSITCPRAITLNYGSSIYGPRSIEVHSQLPLWKPDLHDFCGRGRLRAITTPGVLENVI